MADRPPVELPTMPKLRGFRAMNSKPRLESALSGAASGIVFLLAAVLFVGCQSVQTSPPPPKVSLKVPQEAMFPSLKLNDDLFKPLKPSNNRQWSPELARLAQADLNGNKVTIHNIRDCHWKTLKEFDVSYYDKTFDLKKLRSVDFIVVPFNETPSLGHTMLSFGFEGDDYLAVSIEIRKELGETFNPVAGFFRQYEIIYVVANERDVIQRRVNCDLSDVYVYRSTATSQQARSLFVDVMHRVNKLAKEPEFYDTLTNNCTTNIRSHVNHLQPHEVPYDYRVLLPGHSDKLAFDLGLIERHGSFEETKLHARVNYQAYLHRDDSDFSRLIRQ
jgi:hypothetical protein